MAHGLAELVDARLCEHPSVQQKAEWPALAAQASTALHDLYQTMGGAHMA